MQSGGSCSGFPMQSGGAKSCLLSDSGRVVLANGMFCNLDVSNFVSFSSRLREAPNLY